MNNDINNKVNQINWRYYIVFELTETPEKFTLARFCWTTEANFMDELKSPNVKSSNLRLYFDSRMGMESFRARAVAYTASNVGPAKSDLESPNSLSSCLYRFRNERADCKQKEWQEWERRRGREGGR